MVNSINPKTASHRVGTNVRALRTDLQMTQAELADMMAKSRYPVHLNTISKIERGDRDISVDELEAFARVFGVATESLLEDVGDPEADDFRHVLNEFVALLHELPELLRLQKNLEQLIVETEAGLWERAARRPDLLATLEDAMSAFGRGTKKRSVASVRVAAKKTTKKGGK